MKKTLHMIGNSHIDPVWFWRWQEGMQEVKNTFRSALDRMKEFPEFRFSSTSAAFFAYLQRVDPDMMEEIRRRVAEGRWEIIGGWWVEPDCNLPCGESFVRQALYSQRFFKEQLGVTARIGCNVDSFGHNPQIPQMLRKAGMEGYVFLRPQVTTHPREYVPGRKPVFRWEAPDGTAVTAISLPGEYTTWFKEPTRKNIERTMAALPDYPCLPCCYGVGNHGGGPTIENIRAVQELRADFEEVELRFSSFGAFFDELKESGCSLPAVRRAFDHVNAGCYSVDHSFKQAMRHAEEALLQAEKLMAMAFSLSGQWTEERTAPLWKRLLFEQFHDTLGGTITEEAHADALRDVGGVQAQAEQLAHLAMQDLIRHLRIEGTGTPVVLFNPSEKPYCGPADVEIDWFCQNDLTLLDAEGNEVAYSRVKQSCTMVWTVLGGRRRLLFEANIPPMSAAVYYALPEKPSLQKPVAYEGDPSVLENEFLAFRLDANGNPCSLVDKRTGTETLQGSCGFSLWQDERDPWGGGPRPFHKADCSWVTDEVACIEQSEMRKVLRVLIHTDGLRIETLYQLLKGAAHVRMQVSLTWDKPWHQLRYTLPIGARRHVSEAPYGITECTGADDERFMHRFVDAQRADGSGMALFNDGFYGFQPHEEETDLLLLRSPIYAQGTSPNWYRQTDVYHHLDIGHHTFTILLAPHGAPLAQHELFAMADTLIQPPAYLVGGMCGNMGQAVLPAFRVDHPAIRLGACKKAEDDNGIILRLHETDGSPACARIHLGGRSGEIHFGAYEIKTLLVSGTEWQETDLLEWNPTTINVQEADE